MNISFNNFDAAVKYAAGIDNATVSPVMQDEQGHDFWLVNQPFQTVEDESVFDFIENPLRDHTHLGRSYNGIWIVNSPNREEGQRFKYQSCVPATAEEARFYREFMSSVQEDRNTNYQDIMQEHLSNGGSMEDFN